ncbi:MAG: glycosyltransferase family 4 protein [Clostridiales bacterium]|nr:glycosyltransferase family 4 protein [Clostridiales bacterium]
MELGSLTTKVGTRFKPFIKKVLPKCLIEKAQKLSTDLAVRSFKRANIAAFKKDRWRTGINLIGDINASDGLSQSMRLIESVMTKCRIPHRVHEYSIAPEAEVKTRFTGKTTGGYPYGVNVFHINTADFPYGYNDLGAKAWNGHYNIGYWAWELQEIPEDWVRYIDMVDEIWTPSEFASETFRRYTSKPVITVPHSVDVTFDENIDRGYFGLPEDKFLFLMMYASASISQRKNPMAVIRAFKKAFKPGREDVGLVIKVLPSDGYDEDTAAIRRAVEGYDNIYLVIENLTRLEVNSLMNVVDSYVSLHRAEGFGLPLAESMLLGKPTVATDWSGNLEFMTPETACLVDYDLVELKKDIPPFKKGFHWADPKVNDAARCMKKLLEDKQFYDTISDNAKKYVSERLSQDAVGAIVAGRLKDIYSRH